jgi:hypothetical protein
MNIDETMARICAQSAINARRQENQAWARLQQINSGSSSLHVSYDETTYSDDYGTSWGTR